MLFSHVKNVARLPLTHAPVALSGLLLIGMIALNLLSVSRGHTVVARTVAPPAGDLSIVSTPNRNFSSARSRGIDTIVIHYSSGINVDRARWDDPALVRDIFNRYHVSAHYQIDRGGTVYRLVDERNIAWHAGGSIMPAPDNRKNVNRFSIGIEIIATRKSGFTEAEYASLAKLVNGIRSRYPIRHIVGHDEIAGTRAVALGLRRDVKPDPGPLFDWSRVPGR